MACPKFGLYGSCPAARKGRYTSGTAEPGSWFPLRGWSLIRKKGDQTSVLQSSMSLPVACLVIEDRRFMEVPDMGNQTLPPWIVGGSCDSDGIRTKNMENASQPFPVSVMHGNEQRGDPFSCPWITQRLEGGQIQLIPPAGKKKRRLVTSIQKKSSRKIRRNGLVDGASQCQSL